MAGFDGMYALSQFERLAPNPGCFGTFLLQELATASHSRLYCLGITRFADISLAFVEFASEAKLRQNR